MFPISEKELHTCNRNRVSDNSVRHGRKVLRPKVAMIAADMVVRRNTLSGRRAIRQLPILEFASRANNPAFGIPSIVIPLAMA
jgi:hypothetical protein